MLLLTMFLAIAATALAQAPVAVPKIRTVTAFIQLDRSRYREQIAETLIKLRQAKETFEQAGYEVQTIRITTQPFPEYVRGLSKEQALAFFRDYDALARKENFAASIGPATRSAVDDGASAELLGEILSTTAALNGSIIVAGDDGIRWEAVRAAARLMKDLEEHTEHSRGNFSFAATAMLAPHAPFFPGSYHDDGGGEFAVGLQSANVVAAAFASASDAGAAGKALERALGIHARKVEEIARQIESKNGMEVYGAGSFSSSAERRFDWRGDRESDSCAVRIGRNDDGGRDNHGRSARAARATRGLLGRDAADSGGQCFDAEVERGQAECG